MTDEDISSQRKAKAEERKEEVIKAQTPGLSYWLSQMRTCSKI